MKNLVVSLALLIVTSACKHVGANTRVLDDTGTAAPDADVNNSNANTTAIQELNPAAAAVDFSEVPDRPEVARGLCPDCKIQTVPAAASIPAPIGPACIRSDFDFDTTVPAGVDHSVNPYWMAIAASVVYQPEAQLRATMAKVFNTDFLYYFDVTNNLSYDAVGFFAELNLPATGEDIDSDSNNDPGPSTARPATVSAGISRTGVVSAGIATAAAANGSSGDDSTATAATATSSSHAALIAFRGTKERIDFFTDAHATPTEFYGAKPDGTIDTSNVLGYVHTGFKESVDAVWPNLAKAVKAFKGKGPIWVTGHSLGAAIATLATARLLSMDRSLDIRGLYTFGSPKVGGPAFAQKFSSLIANSAVHRFVDNNDIVTMIPSVPEPPYISGWQHVGDLRWFDGNGNLFDASVAEKRSASASWISALTKQWVTDHYLVNYYSKIEKWLYGDRAECQ